MFLAVLALLLLAGVATALTRTGGPGNGGERRVATAGSGDAGKAALTALRYRRGADEEFTQRAVEGFSHPLYARVPGGAVATARRVAAWRELIEQATAGEDSPVDADTLEALVYLESAGRPDAAATGKASGAVGLTQIMGETGNSLLGMNIDLASSDALTDDIDKLRGQISRWDARGPRSAGAAARGRERLKRLQVRRARADPRYVPREALAGAVRYLRTATEMLGRSDLAFTSYHMGIGNLQNVLRAYGQRSVPYVQLYFDIDPERSPRAYRLLSRFQDDSATYYWRLLAAKQIMRDYRDDAGALARKAEVLAAKASRENLLHPADDTEQFDDKDAIASAVEDGDLIELPIAALNANGIAISPAMGELAGRLDAPRTRYRALRRGSLATLATIGAAVKELSGEKALVATSTVRDKEYQRLLQASNIEATRAYSLHTTGWSVDVSRNYVSARQAQMFQFVLTRMQALNLITWVREPTAIHLTASKETDDRLGPVLEVALGRS